MLKLCKDLQDPKYTLVTDSIELAMLCQYLGIPDESITGALVDIGDGEYNEVWLTESSAPYDLSAWYHSPDFWRESE